MFNYIIATVQLNVSMYNPVHSFVLSKFLFKTAVRFLSALPYRSQ